MKYKAIIITLLSCTLCNASLYRYKEKFPPLKPWEIGINDKLIYVQHDLNQLSHPKKLNKNTVALWLQLEHKNLIHVLGKEFISFKVVDFFSVSTKDWITMIGLIKNFKCRKQCLTFLNSLIGKDQHTYGIIYYTNPGKYLDDLIDCIFNKQNINYVPRTKNVQRFNNPKSIDKNHSIINARSIATVKLEANLDNGNNWLYSIPFYKPFYN